MKYVVTPTGRLVQRVPVPGLGEIDFDVNGLTIARIPDETERTRVQKDLLLLVDHRSPEARS